MSAARLETTVNGTTAHMVANREVLSRNKGQTEAFVNTFGHILAHFMQRILWKGNTFSVKDVFKCVVVFYDCWLTCVQNIFIWHHVFDCGEVGYCRENMNVSRLFKRQLSCTRLSLTMLLETVLIKGNRCIASRSRGPIQIQDLFYQNKTR